MSRELLSFLNLGSFIFSFGLVLIHYIIFSFILIYISTKFIEKEKVENILNKLKFYIRTIVVFYSFYAVNITFNKLILTDRYFESDKFLFTVVYLFISKLIISLHCIITSNEIINDLKYGNIKGTFRRITSMDFSFFDNIYRYESFKSIFKSIIIVLIYIIFNIILIYNL